jgi:GT2 family glycosyltransferase
VIAHLDADTLPSRRWLAEIVTPFEDPQVIIVAGRTVCYPQDTAAGRYVAASGLYETERAINREPFPFAPSLNMAVRRSAALAVGGWAADMMTGEDVDFSHRVLRAFPSRIAYQPKAVLFHNTRASAEELRRQAWTYGEGAADIYLRYPEVVRWDLPKTLRPRRSPRGSVGASSAARPRGNGPRGRSEGRGVRSLPSTLDVVVLARLLQHVSPS